MLLASYGYFCPIELGRELDPHLALGQLSYSNYKAESRRVLTGSGALITLWDMLIRHAENFGEAFAAVQRLRHTLGIYKELGGDKWLMKKHTAHLKKFLKLTLKYCDSVDLMATGHLAANLLENIPPRITIGELDAKIDSIQLMLRRELRERQFLYVPNERAGYYRNRQLLGKLVAEKFPAAVPDIIEAGNCYALERPTACVFHLMRVIPYGMAALAAVLKVTYSKPIQCLEWNWIIEPIDKAVRELQKLPKSPQKQRDQKHYSEIVQHLYFCKDAWRNHVSHALEPYDMNQAKSVMDHVSLIMELVGKRLKKPFTRLR